ncbi:hypothetical protein GF340_00415 [Candidatus Peregrinibacteria bacterium]|nr:hypothetical protein [Candidatus Peregrinibacteria bacterium]
MLIAPILINAQVNNFASQELTNGIIQMITPDSFNFDPALLGSNTEPISVYKYGDPNDPNQTLRILDGEESNLNFRVGLTISDFESSSNAIPYSNFSIASISNNTNGVDINNERLNPPSVNNQIDTPLHCNEQNITDPTICDTVFDTNQFQASGTLINSDPSIDITNTDELIAVADSSQYSIDNIIAFASGELAKITAIPAANLIRVQRGYSATEPTAQTSGSGIIITNSVSDEITILIGEEPTNYRLGYYSTAVALRGIIDQDQEPGTYTGTITFTLYTCSDLSCI